MKLTILALTLTLFLSSAAPVRAESEIPAHTHFVGAQNISLGGNVTGDSNATTTAVASNDIPAGSNPGGNLVGQAAAQSPSSGTDAETNNPTGAYLGVVSLALLVFGF